MISTTTIVLSFRDVALWKNSASKMSSPVLKEPKGTSQAKMAKSIQTDHSKNAVIVQNEPPQAVAEEDVVAPVAAEAVASVVAVVVAAAVAVAAVVVVAVEVVAAAAAVADNF